ncbi:hypothetical protein [Mammaliicoccus virus vB_MscM-PMS2]|nr:hypothetical protein [Mammaliicoccus virus vB_MscM-PMS2]
MNKQDMLYLIDHLITQARYWHSEYAKQNVIQSEYEKIMSYRDKFDKDLYKKGLDIINGIESQSNVESITVFLKGYQVVLDTGRYSSHQLRQIASSLDNGKDIDSQDSKNQVFISKDNIIGHHVRYQTKYKEQYHKER